MVTKIEIYTGPLCIYCDSAKKLLNSIGAEFIEIKLSKYPNKKNEMLSRTGGKKTVPQIFINDAHVGGYSELSSLAASGDLSNLLTDDHKEK